MSVQSIREERRKGTEHTGEQMAWIILNPCILTKSLNLNPANESSNLNISCMPLGL